VDIGPLKPHEPPVPSSQDFPSGSVCRVEISRKPYRPRMGIWGSRTVNLADSVILIQSDLRRRRDKRLLKRGGPNDTRLES
jgi:hypothetical protein